MAELVYCCDAYLKGSDDSKVKCKNEAAFEVIETGVLLCKNCTSIAIDGPDAMLSLGPAYGKAFQDHCKELFDKQKESLN